jgi:mono/diheme cytochrome c family protein
MTLAHAALRANIGVARNAANPLPIDDPTLTAGAKVYHENCAMCHGEPGGEISVLAKGMSPDPPQLFNPGEMVTDDPMGVTYWKVTHGIRLSGMPAFGDTLSETERWQVTALVAHADKLPEAVRAAFTSAEPPEKRPEKPVGSAGEERRPTSPRRR